MHIDNLFEMFKRKCYTIRPFIKTKIGLRLSIAFIAVFIIMFFAPMFHGSVGAALMSCVAAPFLVLTWRKYDKKHSIVPAVFLCIPMILDILIYHTLATSSFLIVAIVCTLVISVSNRFSFFDKIDDNMYTYLTAGGICAAIVIIASLVSLLVSIAWWILCLLAFLAVIFIFFTVVLSTAAYTATDDKRQARKKYIQQQRTYDRETYDAESQKYYNEDLEQ